MKTRKAYVLYQNKPFEDFFPFTGATAYSDKKDSIHGFIKGSIRKFLIVGVRGFIVAELLTKFVNIFGDEVVIQKYINPFGSFALFSPAYRNTVCTQSAYFGKFFNSQFALFKFTFKVLIIHLTAFNINDIRNYNKKLIKIFGYILDLFPRFIIRL